MHLYIATIALAVVAGVSAVNINYYTDGGCASFNGQISNVLDDGSCFSYDIPGTNSANIADCGYPFCECQFFTQDNCEGPSEDALVGDGSSNNNCVSNYGQKIKSFSCIVGSE